MQTDTKRRVFLKRSAASGAVAVAVGAGLLTPQMVLAEWNKAAFESKSVEDVAKNLMGLEGAAEESADINIKAPDIAENGAVVPFQSTSAWTGSRPSRSSQRETRYHSPPP